MADYTKVCPNCYFFDKKSGDCDMCAWGYPYAPDNNGLKPSEVKVCDYKEGQNAST